MRTILQALKTVLSFRVYRWITGISFLLFLALYLTTLPAAYIGGYSSFSALSYLTPQLIGFSVLMATLVALLLPLIIYLIRQGRKSSKLTVTSGVLIGVLAPILCCSPILPLSIGFIVSLLPMFSGTFGLEIQRFFATHQIELFIAASLLLVIALHQNAKIVNEGRQCEI